MTQARSTAIIKQSAPTMYFVGVTTAGSSINRIFPLWVEVLGIDEARLVGIDLPIHAPPEAYRRVVRQIKHDPLSLGALITTHKIDLLAAAHDLFDDLDEYAALCRETSAISIQNGSVTGHAGDPITSGLSMANFLPDRYWNQTGAEVFCIGAGGAGVAITTYFLTRAEPENRPSRLLLVDRDAARLENIRGLVQRIPPTAMAIEFFENNTPSVNDDLMAALKPGSMVINATGMGKDLPGSPLTDQGLFPEAGIAWELNYRGQLDFLSQARQQAATRSLNVQDGWDYFLVGWAHVISTVFHIDIHPDTYAALVKIAERQRNTP